MLRERHDIERHTRWYDIKKKFESDPRYRAVDSMYREEYFEDYLHIMKEEKRRDRELREQRDRERERDRKSDRREKGKDKEKSRKDSRRDRSRSKDRERKSSRDKEERSKSDRKKPDSPVSIQNKMNVITPNKILWLTCRRKGNTMMTRIRRSERAARTAKWRVNVKVKPNKNRRIGSVSYVPNKAFGNERRKYIEHWLDICVIAIRSASITRGTNASDTLRHY